MQVKGTAVKTTRDFMKNRFPELYNKWIDSLPPESKSIFTTTIDSSAWYPINEGYKIPVNSVIKLCYPNDSKKGADQLGSYSAETALKGVYKTFLLIASPQYLIRRASKIFTTYFNGSNIEVEEIDKQTVMFRIMNFDGIDENIEYRIAGWIRKALELANCKEPDYTIKKSLSRGDEVAEIHFFWH